MGLVICSMATMAQATSRTILDQKTVYQVDAIDSDTDTVVNFEYLEFFPQVGSLGVTYQDTTQTRFTSGDNPSGQVMFTANFRNGRVPESGAPGWESSVPLSYTLDFSELGSTLPDRFFLYQEVEVVEFLQEGVRGVELSYNYSLTLNPIPEPTTLVSLGLGLLALGRLRRPIPNTGV